MIEAGETIFYCCNGTITLWYVAPPWHGGVLSLLIPGVLIILHWGIPSPDRIPYGFADFFFYYYFLFFFFSSANGLAEVIFH